MESETQAVSAGGGASSEANTSREQLARTLEALRKAKDEAEGHKEEISRLRRLIESKDREHGGKDRNFEAAQARITELVRQGSEADFKSRSLAA